MLKKRLTIKQKKFVKKFAETGNATRSALEVYNVKDYQNAKAIGWQNLSKPYIMREIEKLMEEQGLTNERLLEELEAGLQSTKISEYKGEVKETEVPDRYLRHKYLDTALKLKDKYPTNKIEQRNLNANIDLELEKLSKEEFANLLREQLEELEREVRK